MTLTLTCPTTNELGYTTKREAQTEATRLLQQTINAGDDTHQLFPYRCHNGCGKWHLDKRQRPSR